MNSTNEQFDQEEEKEMPLKFWGSRSFMFLFYDHWFRVAIVGFLLLLIFLGLFLPKIWRVSPPNSIPEIKISGLDKFQAWSLQRAARKAAARGQLTESMTAWISALFNNPADPKLSRGALQTLLDQPLPPREYLAFAVRRTFRLLQLTHTNAADVSLAAKIFTKFDLHELVVSQLEASPRPLGKEDTAQLLKSLFHSGQMTRFGKMWATNSAAFGADPELQLYHAAWLAGWGPPGSVADGRRALEEAREKQATHVLANRLELHVSIGRNDIARYQSALEELRLSQADTVMENVQLWRLLASNGRKGEAVALVRAFATPPTSPSEVLAMARTSFELGMADDSIKSLESRVVDPNFSWNQDVWVELASQLIQQKRWDDIRGVAIQIRSDELVREGLGGYAYFLEGMAQYGMNRMDLAKEAFAKVPSQTFANSDLAFRTASTMNRLGYFVPARELLVKCEAGHTNKAKFYAELTTAALESKQMDLLVMAAERAHQLAPDNTDYANNYVAALLTLREKPAEAVKLTLRLLTIRPNGIPERVNHVMALLQNLRLDEAEAMLRSIDTSQLQPDEATAYHLAWFELHVRRGHAALAREAQSQIESRYLLPPQAKWMNETLQKLPRNG
jgi:hypothetical protein